jgi:hypothetical protein
MPKPKAKTIKKVAGREELKEKSAKQREKLPTAPRQHLLQPHLLVDWLPYDSIDVIFNDKNIWANRQNHHPACIMYNLQGPDDPDNNEWVQFVKDADRSSMSYEYIKEDVALDPALKGTMVERYEKQLIMELKENMQQYRNKLGRDTAWFENPSVLKHIDWFLEMLERKRRLDVDFCPIDEADESSWSTADQAFVEVFGLPRKYNQRGLPPFPPEYFMVQKDKWARLITETEKFLNDNKLFNVKLGHVWSGFPVHFNTFDKEKIRMYLQDNAQFTGYLEEETITTQPMYTCTVKLFPLLGGVASVWIYIGMQKPDIPKD